PESRRPIAMLRRITFGLLLGSVLLGGCDDLTVPDYNNPSIEDLQTNPTRTGVLTAATGLLVGARLNIADPNAYISLLGILGRESYNFDTAEPRFITELLSGQLTPGGAFGGNLWALRYRNIRNANIVLNALDQVPGLTEQEKSAIRGFAKTIKALDYLLIINTRDVQGAVIDVDRPVGDLNDNPPPIATREQVFQHIVMLLNEAQAHLQAAGGSFPFPLTSGFSNFNTPSSFLRFNRALKARVDVYMRNYPEALQSLQASFLDTSRPLDYGAYYNFGAGSGETQNNLSSATIRAHPSVVANAQRQPSGELDRRVQQKVQQITPRSQLGLSSDLGFTIYPDPDSRVPIITNEELILLRSEARWFTGDRTGATADLNLIRQQAGGLAPIGVPASDDAYVTALLRERAYSLLFEGHRWIDVRRFNRLDLLPLDRPEFIRQSAFPIPEAECLARGILEGECSATNQ
ncbi:MAG TPA: RagB/SusD family nutrient uptake outer membrane protein, partial [Longimicrobiaceae bacterium]|nr:RagB/SusD family nutrient uptake outer membrane protein [Longimicrobiaceae bacterium]